MAGLLFRAVRYLQRPSLWGDEAFLLVNVLELDTGRLLTGRLDVVAREFGMGTATQSAPPGFLLGLKAMEWAGWLVRPVDELAARAIPFGCSLVAVVLFAWLAWRVLREWAWVAVLLFAGSREVIFQAATVKQFGGDVMVAAGLGCMALLPRAGVEVRLVMVTVAGLLAMGISHAAVACVPAALLATVLRGRGEGALGAAEGGVRGDEAGGVGGRGRWRAWGVGGVCVAVTLGAMWVLKRYSVDVQRDPFLSGFWAEGFADWGRPWTIPVWLGGTTWEMFNYAAMGLGVGPVLMGVAAWVRWRRGSELAGGGRGGSGGGGGGGGWSGEERAAWMVALGPMGVVALAAMAGVFPFTGNRVNLFLVPGVILGTVLAAKVVWERSGAGVRWGVGAWAGGVAVAGLVFAVTGAVRGTPSNGAFRELTERAVRDRPTGAQLASLQGVLVDLYAMDRRFGMLAPRSAGDLDPGREVVVVQGFRRGGGRQGEEAFLGDPAWKGRTLVRRDEWPGGGIYRFSAELSATTAPVRVGP